MRIKNLKKTFLILIMKLRGYNLMAINGALRKLKGGNNGKKKNQF